VTDAPNRTDPPLAADEVATLLSFLDYHRDTLRVKTAGLTTEQLGSTLPPTDMTLAGMLKHLALVEHSWFACRFLGEEYAPPWDTVDWRADDDWDWHSAADDSAEELLELWESSVARSRTIVSEALANGGLDQLAKRTSRTGEAFSLRWIIVHMIEEYARHNGHADLLRESIDGSTGE
jgi:uncharacterized damage-inducible protein DinB